MEFSCAHSQSLPRQLPLRFPSQTLGRGHPLRASSAVHTISCFLSLREGLALSPSADVDAFRHP